MFFSIRGSFFKNRGSGGLEFESADSITAPSRRQQFNYYKIAIVGFEGTTLIYAPRILLAFALHIAMTK